jgi:hypothetical protein
VAAALAAAKFAAANTFAPNPRDRDAAAIRAALNVDRARLAGLAAAHPETELLAATYYDEETETPYVTVWATCGSDYWWCVNANGGWYRETDPDRLPHDGDLQPLGTLGHPPGGDMAIRLPLPDELEPDGHDLARAREGLAGHADGSCDAACRLEAATALALADHIRAGEVAEMVSAVRLILAIGEVAGEPPGGAS